MNNIQEMNDNIALTDPQTDMYYDMAKLRDEQVKADSRSFQAQEKIRLKNTQEYRD